MTFDWPTSPSWIIATVVLVAAAVLFVALRPRAQRSIAQRARTAVSTGAVPVQTDADPDARRRHALPDRGRSPAVPGRAGCARGSTTGWQRARLTSASIDRTPPGAAAGGD